MAVSPLAARWSVFLRVAVMLLPAFYCSWYALRMTLQLTLFQSELYDDRPFARRKACGHAPLLPSISANHAADNLTKSGTSDSTEQGCFHFNSNEWLEGPRHGNYNEDGLNLIAPDTISAFPSLLLVTSGSLQPILQESLCEKNSPLLSLNNSNLLSENHSVRLWTARLLYLVINEHQRSPALLEASHRSKEAQCLHAAKDYGIGRFDFECPSAKFLVVSFCKNGVGANLRLVAVPALMAGLASNRVVVFVNDAATGPSFLQEPWALASCNHRQDAQCFFRPATPCVLTNDELATAYTLQRGEARRLFRSGQVPDERADERVLILHLRHRPQRQPENLRAVLHDRATALIERLVASDDNRLSPSLFHKAANAILQVEEPPTTSFNYYGAGSQIFQSLLIYAMRPNAQAIAQMEAILREVMPDDFVTEDALGLQIRGTYTHVDAAINDQPKFSARLADTASSFFQSQPPTSAALKASVYHSINTWRQRKSSGWNTAETLGIRDRQKQRASS